MSSASFRTRLASFALVCLAAFALFGCASPTTLVPQQSTLNDVHDRVGPPTDVRVDANGDELWEYAKGPAGYETWLVRIGQDSKVKSVTQLITQEHFDRIVVGKTTKTQMRELFGRPSDVRRFGNGLVWEWRAQIPPAERGVYAVRFENDNVVREKMVLPDPKTDGGDRGGGK